MTRPTALLDPPDDDAVTAALDEHESEFIEPRGRAFYGDDQKKTWEQIALGLFIAVPFLAVLAAVPIAWGWGLGWSDIVIALVMYFISGFGITGGFHRYFTHGAFKAKRALRIGLAVAGSLAV